MSAFARVWLGAFGTIMLIVCYGAACGWVIRRVANRFGDGAGVFAMFTGLAMFFATVVALTQFFQ